MVKKRSPIYWIVLCCLLLASASLPAFEFTMPEDVSDEELTTAPKEETDYGDSKYPLDEFKSPTRKRSEPAVAETDSSGAGEVSDSDAKEPGFIEIPLLEAEIEPNDETAIAEEILADGEGRIVGQVFDKETGAPVRGVAIAVEGTDFGTITDEAGNFKINAVPEGKYTLAYFKTGYLEANVTDVAVKSGEVKTLNFALPPRPAEISDDVYDLGTVTVTAEQADQLMTNLELRINATSQLNLMGSEDFSKYAANDVADALIRVPGVSVAGGEFAVIRGLSDRYANTLLNGLKIPSPDPEKQAVQLDIFPTNLINNIVVSKTFMPDLWGDSSGGSIDMRTSLIPDEREISVSLGIKINENALGEKIPDYSTNGNNDFWGFGENDRPSPGERSTFQVVPDYRNAPIGNKFSISYEDRFEFENDKALGLTTALVRNSNVSAKSGRRTSLTTQNRIPPSRFGPAQPSTMEQGILLPANDFQASDFDQAVYENTLGVLASAGFQFSPQHEFGATVFFSQSGIDTVEKKIFDPVVNEPDLSPFTWYRDNTYYRQRNITAYQLQGIHEFESWNDLKVEWIGQQTDTYQHEPNYTEATYAMDSADQYVLSSIDGTPNVLERAWNDTDENQQTGRVDATLPFVLLTDRESSIKAGFAGEYSERTNKGFNEIYSRPNGNSIVADDPQSLYDDLLLTPSGAAGTSTSEAERTLTAIYGMLNIELPKNLKLSGGYRLENFEMTSVGIGSYGNTSAQDLLILQGIADILGTNTGNLTSALDEKDLLPAIGLTWNPIEDVTLRLNYSKTIARPSFRELGPYFSQSFETGNLILGNPALEPSDIENYDFRAEWYFSEDRSDMFAVSVFAKTIKNPIEKMLFDSILGPFESWANNPGEADLKGIELEARKGLGFIHESLSSFSIGGNVTKIDAEVPLHPATIAQLTNVVYLNSELVPKTRRLFDQPEWLANVDITYSEPEIGTNITLSLYAISDVLALPGSGFPAQFDLYEKGYLRLDLGISQELGKGWAIRLSAKNLLDPKRGLIYDPDLTNQEYERTSFRTGREYSLSLSKNF